MLAIKWPYMSLAIKWPYDLSSNVQGPPFLNYSPEYNLKISPVKFLPQYRADVNHKMAIHVISHKMAI